jgi:fructose-1,6-bisphosphatase/inositol monophosphatase family enzyme
VAAGVADVYVELADFPMTEVFSGGLMIADTAGCVTTDLRGAPVRFDPDAAKRYALVCAATPELHRETLALLARKA